MSPELTMKQNWEWIDPPGLRDVCRFSGIKAFACVPFAIEGFKSWFKEGVQPSQVLEMFRKEIHRHWEAGKNVILGSEEIDRITITGRDNSFFADQLFSLLPDGYVQYTEIVTVYRAPRIKHLISRCKEQYKGVEHWTLQQCLSDPDVAIVAHVIDSLSLTKTFLDMGLQVTMLDMSDLHFDLYQIMACDIMKEPCDSKKNPLYLNRIEHEKIERGEQSVIQSLRKKMNVRTIDTELMNIPQDVLDKIDNLLETYDCGFKLIEHHPNLTVLYSSAYKEKMAQCPGLASNVTSTIMSRGDMYQEIRALTLS